MRPPMMQVVMVGPYSVRVEGLLGEGGLATVYRAVTVTPPNAPSSSADHHTPPAAALTFALKHMRLANAEAVRDMTDEARTLAKVWRAPY